MSRTALGASLLLPLLAQPAAAASLHAIHGCVLETWEPVKDKVVRITYLDLGKVQDIHVLGAAGKVQDSAPLQILGTGAQLSPYRVEPGGFRTPEIIQTFIHCNNRGTSQEPTP